MPPGAPSVPRSRTGCYTCRARKKKCGEDFNADGVCGRCAQAEIRCERDTPLRPRSSNAGKPKPRPAGVAPAPYSLAALRNNKAASRSPTASASPVASTSSSTALPVPLPAPNPPQFLHPAPPHLYTGAPAGSSSTPAFVPDFPPRLDAQLEPSHMGAEIDLHLNSNTIDIDWAALLNDFDASTPMASDELAMPQADNLELLVAVAESNGANPSKFEGVEDVKLLPGEAAAIYDQINTSLYQAIPEDAREMITRRWAQLAGSTALGRAASMAIITMCVLRSPQTLDDEMKERLAAQSQRYFATACEHLTDSAPSLEARINSILDLHHHQLDQSGAAAAYACMIVGDIFCVEAMGERPKIDFSELRALESQPLCVFAYRDVLRSVCTGDRQTLFDFVGIPGDPAPATPSNGTINTLKGLEGPILYLGLPSDLLLCWAGIVRLVMEGAEWTPQERSAKAAVLERSILSWQPSLLKSATPGDSWAIVVNLATQEMWRQAALLYLYQSVLHLGCLSAVICEARDRIIKLGTRTMAVDEAPQVWTGSVRCCPWFFASTVATDAKDREACRQGLRECGPARVFQDNLKVAEAIWARMDQMGWVGEWRDVVRERGEFVAFL